MLGGSDVIAKFLIISGDIFQTSTSLLEFCSTDEFLNLCSLNLNPNFDGSTPVEDNSYL